MFSKGLLLVEAERILVSMRNDRIVIDPKICHGKPVIRGTRTPVAIVVGSLAGGMSFGVDLTGRSGADALLVYAGPMTGKVADSLKTNKEGAAIRGTSVTAGKNTFIVMTIHQGEGPKIAPAGDDLLVGDRRVRFDGQSLSFDTAGAP